MTCALLTHALFVVRDRFGEAVADRLEIPPERRLTVTDTLYPAEIPFGRPIVVVHSGHDPALRDTVDTVAFDRGVPCVGVELLPTRLVCGPMVVPGRTACYHCFERRLEQHSGGASSLPASTRDLPEGFAPHHAVIAAGLVRAALAETSGPVRSLGATVRTFDLVTGAVRASSTVAVNRCRRCGDRFRGLASPVDAIAALP